jgi:hypothetical protein
MNIVVLRGVVAAIAGDTVKSCDGFGVTGLVDESREPPHAATPRASCKGRQGNGRADIFTFEMLTFESLEISKQRASHAGPDVRREQAMSSFGSTSR